MKPPHSTARRPADLLVCLMFGLLISLPTLDWLFDLDTSTPQDECRNYAELPDRPDSLEGLLAYPGDFEAWFNDHFGFRDRFIKTYNRFSKKCFGINRRVMAVECLDGWYFYTADGLIDYHKGRPPLDDAALRVWRNALLARRAHVESMGGRYLLVFIPNKHTVYSDKMNNGMRNHENVPTRLDQLLSHLDKTTDLDVIDLRGTLIEAARVEQVYHKHDTHWNALGAFAGAQVINRWLARHFKDVPALDRADFTLKYRDSEYGDLVKMLGLEKPPEKSPWLVPKQESRYRVTNEVNYTDASPGFPPPKFTEAPGAPIGKALFLHDSFTKRLEPYLSDRFGRSVYIWTKAYPKDVVEAERPDVVMQIMVERWLHSYTPDIAAEFPSR